MMQKQLCKTVSVVALTAAVWLSGSGLSAAQTYSSGSTGALGPFAPAANTTVTLPVDGVLNYTTVSRPRVQ